MIFCCSYTIFYVWYVFNTKYHHIFFILWDNVNDFCFFNYYRFVISNYWILLCLNDIFHLYFYVLMWYVICIFIIHRVFVSFQSHTSHRSHCVLYNIWFVMCYQRCESIYLCCWNLLDDFNNEQSISLRGGNNNSYR